MTARTITTEGVVMTKATLRAGLCASLALTLGCAPATETVSSSAAGLLPTWSPSGATSHARFEARYVKLKDGRVLAIGGDTGWFAADGQTSVEAYDPAQGAWAAVADAPVPLDWFFSALLLDGRVLVWGRGVSPDGNFAPHDDSFVYDPAIDRWSPTGRFPMPIMNTHSSRPAAWATTTSPRGPSSSTRSRCNGPRPRP
jgi:hypothetical protein